MNIITNKSTELLALDKSIAILTDLANNYDNGTLKVENAIHSINLALDELQYFICKISSDEEFKKALNRAGELLTIS